ncbi:MAG TPA: DUF3037 domain-containing protein [Candidatus Janibacter merdipullorum]|nr:DUF3037 domain-containing protein [Candidatus Janibacter merdipullorum]
MSLLPYQYVVLRAEREEFVNVCIVLRCQAADHLEAAFAVGRERGGRPLLGDDGRRFGWLSAPRSTVVRPGPVHSGLTDDPSAEVQRLLERLVR